MKKQKEDQDKQDEAELQALFQQLQQEQLKKQQDEQKKLQDELKKAEDLRKQNQDKYNNKVCSCSLYYTLSIRF